MWNVIKLIARFYQMTVIKMDQSGIVWQKETDEVGTLQ